MGTKDCIELELKKCIVCEQLIFFDTKRPKALFCSDDCFRDYYYKEKFENDVELVL